MNRQLIDDCPTAIRTAFAEAGQIAEPAFAKIFGKRRRKGLPPWAEKSRFDHFYRLTVNTRIPTSEAGKELHAGDEVVL